MGRYTWTMDTSFFPQAPFLCTDTPIINGRRFLMAISFYCEVHPVETCLKPPTLCIISQRTFPRPLTYMSPKNRFLRATAPVYNRTYIWGRSQRYTGDRDRIKATVYMANNNIGYCNFHQSLNPLRVHDWPKSLSRPFGPALHVNNPNYLVQLYYIALGPNHSG